MYKEIGKINSKMVAFSKDRLKIMGEYDSGLYDYYAKRVAKGLMLTEEDIYLIYYILSHYAQYTGIHEMACGVGQLAHSLSLLGFSQVSATEINNKRFSYSVEMGKSLNSNCNIYKQNFREFDYKNIDLIVCVNGIGSLGIDLEKDIKFFKDKVDKGIDIIVNLSDDGVKNSQKAWRLFKEYNMNGNSLDCNFILLRGKR